MAGWMILMVLLAQVQWEGAQAAHGIECSPDGSICTVEGHLKMWGDRRPCTFSKAEYPRTEQELVQAVAEAVRHGTKVKVASGSIHGTPKLVCPGSSSGTLISTRDFDGAITVDAAAGTVTLGAGARLYQLLEKLGEAGLALPNVPVWGGLSVVGALSTGAHGSSHWPGSRPLHDQVLALRLVVPASPEDGYARVLEVSSSQEPEILAAARISLGVLGVISQVTLRVEPIFKRNFIQERAGDHDLADRIASLSRESEFGEVRWFPSQRQAIYLHSDRVAIGTPGDAVLPEPALAPMSSASLAADRELQEAAEATGNRALLCDEAKARLESFPLGHAPTLVGFSHSLQASAACLLNRTDPSAVCFFEDASVLMQETSLAIPLSRISNFIKDVQKLRDKRPDSLCGLGFYYGFWLRFIKGGSQALLGETEDSVDVNALYLRSRQASQPRLDEDVLEEIEQLALLKYGGKAHWGKSNRHVSFLNAATKFGVPLQRFVDVKARLDPHGLFSSTWTDAVLGINDISLIQLKPFCALEGLCICREHSHCAPEQGYFCRPGLVFPQSRVCRYQDTDVKAEL